MLTHIIAYRNKTYQATFQHTPCTNTRPGSCMYAAMSESWPGSGIVVSYKKQGFEECLGNVMTFNSLLIIYGLKGVLEFTYLNLETLPEISDIHTRLYIENACKVFDCFKH